MERLLWDELQIDEVAASYDLNETLENVDQALDAFVSIPFVDEEILKANLKQNINIQLELILFAIENSSFLEKKLNYNQIELYEHVRMLPAVQASGRLTEIFASPRRGKSVTRGTTTVEKVTVEKGSKRLPIISDPNVKYMIGGAVAVGAIYTLSTYTPYDITPQWLSAISGSDFMNLFGPNQIQKVILQAVLESGANVGVDHKFYFGDGEQSISNGGTNFASVSFQKIMTSLGVKNWGFDRNQMEKSVALTLTEKRLSSISNPFDGAQSGSSTLYLEFDQRSLKNVDLHTVSKMIRQPVDGEAVRMGNIIAGGFNLRIGSQEGLSEAEIMEAFSNSYGSIIRNKLLGSLAHHAVSTLFWRYFYSQRIRGLSDYRIMHAAALAHQTFAIMRWLDMFSFVIGASSWSTIGIFFIISIITKFITGAVAVAIIKSAGSSASTILKNLEVKIQALTWVGDAFPQFVNPKKIPDKKKNKKRDKRVDEDISQEADPAVVTSASALLRQTRGDIEAAAQLLAMRF